eukprot:TRINITY_DN2614_c0_g1_i11.p2 TRINITY_DN2614_c0_g1~~TRINITY_DN2614_c0_g1_i11.p2  ORF type:complete len:435 (+),score=125.76 TRINITY_DN2614_c0_g1_i11:602-1906(+)
MAGLQAYLQQVRKEQEKEEVEKKERQASGGPPEPQPSQPAFSVGARVQVAVSKVAPALVGLEGVVKSVDSDAERLVVELPSPHGCVSLRRDQLSAAAFVPPPAPPPPAPAPASAPAAASPSRGKYVPPSQRGKKEEGGGKDGGGWRGGAGGGALWGSRGGYNPPARRSAPSAGSSLADRVEGTFKAPLEPALEKRGGDGLPEWRDEVQQQVPAAHADKQFSMPRHEEERCSKQLVWILRHGGTAAGYRMTADGFVRVSEILEKAKELHRVKTLSAGHVRWMAAHNDKQRFRLKECDGELWIAASQGHSCSLGLGTDHLTAIRDPHQHPFVVHGTFFDCIGQIMQDGLKPMDRQHVHFCDGDPGRGKKIRGLRKSAEVLVFVDLPMCYADGIEFFVATNGVVLTPGNRDRRIPPRYFKSVVNAETREPHRESDWR